MAVEEMLKELSEETAITFKLSKEELELIKKGSELSGIGHTTFSRQAAIKEARKMIKEFS